MTRSPRIKGYARGLDGIRAIAVLGVVLYHAGVPFLPGGFLGVDLFFVVSGYLVTALLQREHDRTGRIDLRGFWLRRARRLLPALLLMLLVVCAATLACGRDLGAGLRWQLAGALTFSSNWLQIANGSSYLETMEPALLTHLWSLAVEEQFYLLWPLAVLFLLTVVKARRSRAALAVLVALASAAAMFAGYRTGTDPTRIYAATDTHGFGLLLGAALALARPASELDPVRGARRRGRGTDLLGFASLAVVLGGMVVLDLENPWTYRGGLLLVSLAAVGLVAVTIRGSGPVAKLLGSRVLRPVGERSYSLYLWHWPAVVMADRILAVDLGRPLAAAVGVVAAVLATEITFRLVERPIRRFGFRGYLRAARRVLLRRGRVRPVRRSMAWFAATCLGVVTVTAACGVVAAPARSGLEIQLAAGEQALAEASAAAQASTSATTVPSTTATPSTTPASTTPTTATQQPTPTTTAKPTTPTPSTSKPTTPTPTTSKPTTSKPTTSTPTSPKPTTTQQPKPPKNTPPPPEVPGDRIAMIGDSVMLAAAPSLLSRMPGASIDAVVSRQIWDLPGLLPGGAQDRPYVVIGLGTNGTEPAQTLVDALGALPESTVVVLVTTFGPQEWQDDANAQIAAAASTRAHTCVADWRAAIEGKKDLLAADGIHPGPEAGGIYADLVASTLRNCH
ncbi:acyltransferase family protein [Nakamurella alba]|uniref:acyltransferase family protein n=1 Tax=Nakamurella alba TaxID=2665158 RepID=UPI0012B8E365|nr:acyltransferase family protein [Nakamurella alba]